MTTSREAAARADAMEPEFNERFERDGILAALSWVLLAEAESREAAVAEARVAALREAAMLCRKRAEQFHIDDWPLIGDEHRRTADYIEALAAAPVERETKL